MSLLIVLRVWMEGGNQSVFQRHFTQTEAPPAYPNLDFPVLKLWTMLMLPAFSSQHQVQDAHHPETARGGGQRQTSIFL
jgi:hypothetical protein